MPTFQKQLKTLLTYKNLVDLDLQAIFAKWMEGLYSIVLLAALGFPFLLFKYLSKEKTQ